MKLKNSKTWIIVLLLSGLTFHDFLTISSFKLGPITITYLRVILLICIPLLCLYKIKLYKHDWIAHVLIVFMVYGLVRTEGNIKQSFNLYCPLLAFLFLYISIDNVEQMKSCINFLATMLIFFCFEGLFEIVFGYHFGDNYLKATTNTPMIAFGMYFNENDFSAFLTVLIFYMLLSNYRKVVKVLVIVLAIAIIVINSSQICLLGILSFMPIAYVLKGKNHKGARFIIITLVAAVMRRPVMDMIMNSSIYYRAYMYRFGIKNCIEHLWFGTGIGKYSEGMFSVGYEPMLNTSADPHNIYLELAGQFGLIWLILLFILIAKLLVRFYKRMNRSDSLFYFGLVYVVSFVGLASSSCLEKNYIYLALLLPLSYLKLSGRKYNIVQESMSNVTAAIYRENRERLHSKSDLVQ